MPVPVTRETLLVQALPTKSVSSVEVRRITLLPNVQGGAHVHNGPVFGAVGTDVLLYDTDAGRASLVAFDSAGVTSLRVFGTHLVWTDDGGQLYGCNVAGGSCDAVLIAHGDMQDVTFVWPRASPRTTRRYRARVEAVFPLLAERSMLKFEEADGESTHWQSHDIRLILPR